MKFHKKSRDFLESYFFICCVTTVHNITKMPRLLAVKGRITDFNVASLCTKLGTIRNCSSTRKSEFDWMIYSCYNPLQKATLVSAVDVYEEEESELLVSFNRKLSLKLIVQLRIIIDAFVSFRNKILILYFLYTPKYIEETNSAGISSVSSRVNNSECFFPDQSIFKRLTGEQSSSFAFQWNSAPNSVGKSFKSMMLHNDNDF